MFNSLYRTTESAIHLAYDNQKLGIWLIDYDDAIHKYRLSLNPT